MEPNQETVYLIIRKKVVEALQLADPEFVSIMDIQNLANGGLKFLSTPIKQGFIVRTPTVTATKAEISNLLQTHSGITLNPESIQTVELAEDATFVAVKVV